MQAYYEHMVEGSAWHWQDADPVALSCQIVSSPLGSLVLGLMPPSDTGVILDAGCGVGAWVYLLTLLGYRVVGADDNSVAIRRARSAGLTVEMADATRLPWDDNSVSVYLSLGVVEHDPGGPWNILRESTRVLRPGGRALISVPYRNRLRRIFRDWIELRQCQKALNGASFYQYAFSEREILDAIHTAGLVPISSHLYGPTKMFRVCLPASTRVAIDSGTAAGSSSILRRLVRRFLYTPLALRWCAHMILVVAEKP